MATISNFPTQKDKNSQLSDVVLGLRELLNGEDIRFVLGDLFLRIAANAPIEDKTPYSSLLKKLTGDQEFLLDNSLRILMENFDLLREHDIYSQHRKNLRKMLKETNHGQDLIEKSIEWRREFREKIRMRKEENNKAKNSTSAPLP